jgi:hypothetical protein
MAMRYFGAGMTGSLPSAIDAVKDEKDLFHAVLA